MTEKHAAFVRLAVKFGTFGNCFALNQASPICVAKDNWTSFILFNKFGRIYRSQLAVKSESRYKIATIMDNSPDIYRGHHARLCLECFFHVVDFRSREILFNAKGL
jgi:hypothetical protein